ncbi:hypothetical protein D3C80_1534550 [compost metagenome]
MAEVKADTVAAAIYAAELAGKKSDPFGQGYLQQHHRVQPLRERDPQKHAALRQVIFTVLPGRTLQQLGHQLQPGTVFPVQDSNVLPKIKSCYIQQIMQQPLIQRAGLPVRHLLRGSHHRDQLTAACSPARPQGRRDRLAERTYVEYVPAYADILQRVKRWVIRNRRCAAGTLEMQIPIGIILDDKQVMSST